MGTTKLKHYLVKFQSIIALLIMCIVLSFLSDRFLTGENAWNVMRQISVNVIISVGMTLVILTGGIDLSVGSVLALAGAVTAGMLKFGAEFTGLNLYLGFTLIGALLGGTLVGTILGWFNGFTITRFKVPPFVATLAMLTIARGLTMLLTGGFPITGLGEEMAFIGTGWFLGIPMPVWISAVIVVAAVILTKRTKLGRHIYAIGGNETASRLSGLKIKRVKLIVYSIAGALAGVGGIIVTSRLDSAQPNAGFGFELDSIAAVVIGGTSLSGGKGTIIGTVQGALIIGILNNGLVLLNVSPFWQQVIKGFVILLAVVIEKFSSKSDAE
jgi:ribose transport system permease protein